jgi:hypothetical protein
MDILSNSQLYQFWGFSIINILLTVYVLFYYKFNLILFGICGIILMHNFLIMPKILLFNYLNKFLETLDIIFFWKKIIRFFRKEEI